MNELNNIVETVNSQVSGTKIYIEKLLKKLPQSIEESAKSCGAMVRRRVIKSAVDLITVLFIYAVSNMSLRMLAFSAALMGAANISDQAWQKKIVNCGSWLSFILKETMPKLSNDSRKPFNGRTVKLLDGSTVQQAGTKHKRGGEALRIHMCYNLTDGCMDSIEVTDAHTAENVTRHTIESGVIYMADAGYGKGNNIAHILSCKADAIFRATPNHLSLAEDERGKIKLDMAEKLNTKKNLVNFTCYVHAGCKKYVPIRIIASRLPEDKALSAKERKIRSAKKRQTKKIRENTLLYAEWVIIITTLDAQYSAESLLEMYRSRWQIELLFKRVKQSFKVSYLPAASLNHSKVMILLWLILWSLTEQNSIAMEIFLLNKGVDMSRYSPWAFQCFLFQQMKTVINCLWAFSFNLEKDAIPAYRRLRNHLSSRPNQFAQFRFEL